MGNLSLLVATLFLIEVYAGIPVMSRVVEDENKALVQHQIAVPQDEWTKLEVGSKATTAPGRASEVPQNLVARDEPAMTKRRSWGSRTFSLGRKNRSGSRAGSPPRSDSISRAGSFSSTDSDGSRPTLQRSLAFREGSKRYRSFKIEDVVSPARKDTGRSLSRRRSSLALKS